MSDVDPNAIQVIASVLLLHIAVTALPWAAIRDARARQDPPTFRYRAMVITALTPAVLFGLIALFPPSPGADGLGGVMPGLFVMCSLPTSWLVLLVIAIWHWTYKPPSEW